MIFFRNGEVGRKIWHFRDFFVPLQAAGVDKLYRWGQCPIFSPNLFVLLIRIDTEVSEESTRMLCFRYVAIGRKIWAFPLRGRVAKQ